MFNKKQSALVSLLLLTGAHAWAQAKPMNDMSGMGGMNAAAPMAAPQSATHRAVGVVKSLDKKAGRVMLAHEAVKDLNWPAMTMGFLVKDDRLLDKLIPGKKIELDFFQAPVGNVIVEVR